MSNFFEKSFEAWDINQGRSLEKQGLDELFGNTQWRDPDDSCFANGAYATGLRVLGNAMLSRFVQSIELPFDECESPIERAMMLALMTVAARDEVSIRLEARGYTFDIPFSHGRSALVTILPQVPIGEYRVDFLIERTERVPDHDNLVETGGMMIPDKKDVTAKLVVECDGHDFHERTKEQARRDKSRDRALVSCGFEVFHYTGSEIWADVFKCAEQVFKHLRDKVDQA